MFRDYFCVCVRVHSTDADGSLGSRWCCRESIAWRIEGTFDSNYSLALLNRETARALDGLGHRVILHSTEEDPEDFPTQSGFLACQSGYRQTACARNEAFFAADPDVTTRNLYPPRVADMDCRMNLLHHYAWEESSFTLKLAENFNEHLQGMSEAPTLHGKNVLNRQWMHIATC